MRKEEIKKLWDKYSIRNKGDEYSRIIDYNNFVFIINEVVEKVSQVEKPVGVPSENSFGQWIDSEQRLPAKSERVLVYNENDVDDEYSVDYRFLGGDMKLHWDWNEDDNVWWMPLPEKPLPKP